MTTCRSCGAEIFWAQTKGGKAMPLDVVPREDGNVKVIGGSAFVEGARQPLAPGARYVSHFATCPNSVKHRRQGETDGR